MGTASIALLFHLVFGISTMWLNNLDMFVYVVKVRDRILNILMLSFLGANGMSVELASPRWPHGMETHSTIALALELFLGYMYFGYPGGLHGSMDLSYAQKQCFYAVVLGRSFQLDMPGQLPNRAHSKLVPHFLGIAFFPGQFPKLLISTLSQLLVG